MLTKRVLVVGAVVLALFGSGLGMSEARAQEAVKPWFLIFVDSSGSMCENDVNVANSCGFPKTIKMNAAKCAIQNILNATGDAEFGLAQFAQNTNCTGVTVGDTAASGFMRVGISQTGGLSILPLVDGVGAPTGDCNNTGSSVATGNNTLELCSGGGTPSSGALRMVQDYFQGNLGGFTAPTEVDDTALGCRPISVIFLTDGQSNSGGLPEDRAAELLANMRLPTEAGENCPGDAGCVPVPIRTYPIGFGITPGVDTEIERIAISGGTDAPGQYRGYYAADEAELSEALARIIFDAQLFEVCNGVDDTCDGIVDEGYETWCDYLGIRTENPQVPDPVTGLDVDQATIAGSNLASYTCPPTGMPSCSPTCAADEICVAGSPNFCVQCGPDTYPLVSCCDPVPDFTPDLLCESPGEMCNDNDDDCDGEVDELAPGEQYLGPIPAEVCFDFLDNDCDGDIDEGCAGCSPNEACNNIDDDCDGFIDEDLTRSCGFELDQGLFPNSTCRSGQQVCVLGQWGAFPDGLATPPWSVDDSGYDRTCTAVNGTNCAWVGTFDAGKGTCIEKATEACDGLDNDCNTIVDDVAPRPCNPDVAPAFANTGQCQEGSQFCDPSCVGQTSNPDCDPVDDLWGECLFYVGPGDEVCDAEDNDCDNSTDEDDSTVSGYLERACGADIGICEPGIEVCNESTGAYEGCTADPVPGDLSPTDEVCDGLDNDCDGRTDEYDPALNADCVPNPVNGNGFTYTAPPGASAVAGECTAGRLVCAKDPSDGNNVKLKCINYKGPAAEQCDALDRDCVGNNTNGVGPLSTDGDPRATGSGTDPDLNQPCFPYTDTNYPSYPQALRGQGQCTPGIVLCDIDDAGSPGAPVEACDLYGLPSDEVCDGLDNDCDGSFDEDVYTGADVCQTGDSGATPAFPFPFVTPRQFCGKCLDVNGKVVVCRESLLDGDGNTGTTNPATECVDLGYGDGTVNFGGVSDCCNDHDFSSNWAYGNRLGLYLTGGDSTCKTGLLRCVTIGGEAKTICDGEVTPGEETCDGKDNDCDGETDEFIPTEGQTCKDEAMLPGPITGKCRAGNLACTGVTGMQCSGFIGPDANESCNFVDDDCDGFTDERNPGGGANCGGNSANCLRRVDPANAGQAETVPCGECEFGILTCVPLNSSDDIVGSLSFLDPTAVGSDLRCLNDVGPVKEVCDGSDNDCDSKCLVKEDGTKICPAGVTDADDKIDEDVEVDDPRIGMECGATNEGPCMKGAWACVSGGYSCVDQIPPGVETCNGIDDDCDGVVDDGIPLGESCFDLGATPESLPLGECAPGKIACDPVNGTEICTGQTGPTEEVCDGRDNDCDGASDEDLGLGEECGTDEGTCEKGRFACADGQIICQGQVTPSPETCDCSDNDCDGRIDEETGANPLCPGKAACVMCQCALPCTEGMEFAAQCPQGKAAVDVDDQCYCVGAQCKTSECVEEILEVDGAVVCHPDSDNVAPCACKNNECGSVCSGVVCEGGLVCDKTDGRCKQPSCLLKQFECEGGQRCQLSGSSWSCVDDPCADKDCGADEACRVGVCVKSCAKVQCDSGNRCEDGNCVPDRCFGKQCDVGEVCNPADGDCVLAGECVRSSCADGEVCDPVGGECSEDPCLGTRCPRGEQCNSDSSQCEARCFGNLLFCDDSCINPQNSKSNCGAASDCLGDNAGAACAAEEVCSRGECSDSCADDLLNCAGECINPKSDQMHCGAKDTCEGADDGMVCQTGYVCMDGTCRSILSGDGDGDGDAPGGAEADIGTRVIASGGGGCTCTVPVGAMEPPSGAPGSSRGPLALTLVGLALVALGRRRRFGWLGRVSRLGGVSATQWLLLALLLLSMFAGGCKVDPFCLDCPSEGSLTGTEEDGGTNPSGFGDAGSSTPTTRGDGGPLTPTDAGPDTIKPDACGLIEVCNGIDDDCDGKTDEDVDPTSQGIDYDTDILNCGGCGNACRIEHAFSACTDGACKLDRSQGENGCDVGFYDLDKDEANGCEYRCTETSKEDLLCDLLDNDCDGKVDEDIAFDTDTKNCGSCGRTCFFSQATDGARCAAGVCILDDTKCDAGFRNLDGIDQNGCEWQCDVPDPVDELCNGLDDDCDGKPDEGVAATDPAIGPACGTDVGECQQGTWTCVKGGKVCTGQIVPAPNGEDICDLKDNDCDGKTDENDARTGTQCGSNVGACAFGEILCNPTAEGTICGGPNRVTPAAYEVCNFVDDDCDGSIDEKVNVDPDGAGGSGLVDIEAVDVDCSNRGTPLFPPQVSDQGLCDYGKLVCRGGQFDCDNEIGPADELCDNADHDCDGTPVPADVADLEDTDPQIGPNCSNQLGICGEGIPGTWYCADIGSGTPNWVKQCSAGSVSPEPVESCDGEDDDCNGTVDDNVPSVKCLPQGVTSDCESDGSDPTCRCLDGNSFCSGGQLGCLDFVGPLSQEICNGIDDDCDGEIDENAQYIGDECNDMDGDPATDDPYSILGICKPGEWQCVDTGGGNWDRRCLSPAGGPTKVIPLGGAGDLDLEYCNDDDDDCDGFIDESGWDAQGGPAEGQTCCPQAASGSTCYDAGLVSAQAGICEQGTIECQAGAPTCIQPNWNPGPEVCDVGVTKDNDCDGLYDEGFVDGEGLYAGQARSIAHCGMCGNDCRVGDNQAANAQMACDEVTATCEIAVCLDDYLDTPGGDPDCERGPCPDYAQEDLELCNNADDDCDGNVDEVGVPQEMDPPPAATFCDQDGACAGAVPLCVDIDPGAPVTKAWQCDKLPNTVGNAPFDACDASDMTDPTAPAQGVDDDCDNRIDENDILPSDTVHTPVGVVAIGEPCYGPGTGACRLTGEFACDPANPGELICVNASTYVELEADAGGVANEVCDGIDNDCDGLVDEPCPCDPLDAGCLAGIDTTKCVVDEFVALDAANTWMFKYEASRPNATAGEVGTKRNRACSKDNVMPWTQVSYAAAQAACAGYNDGAGRVGRLCTRAEWVDGCDCSKWADDNSGGTTGGCTTTFTDSPCNFWHSNAGSPGVTAPTGSIDDCMSTDLALDMNGNVKELTQAELDTGGYCNPESGASNCRIMVRGGAANNFENGATCGYALSYWPDAAPFANVGFRCCVGPALPPAPDCGSVQTYDGHDYFLCTTNRNYAAARATCQGVGMDLAVVDDSAEQAFINGLLAADTWFGGNDIVTEGNWVWNDDPTLFWQGGAAGSAQNGYDTNWNTGEPNDYNAGVPGEDCGHLRSDGLWNDSQCTATMDVLCESL